MNYKKAYYKYNQESTRKKKIRKKEMQKIKVDLVIELTEIKSMTTSIGTGEI